MSNENWEAVSVSDDEGEQSTNVDQSQEGQDISQPSRSDSGSKTYHSYSDTGNTRRNEPREYDDRGRDSRGGQSGMKEHIPVPEGPTRFIAKVFNIHFRASLNDIGEHFQQGGCEVADVILHMNESGRFSGTAFVFFEDKASLDLSLEANDTEIGGRPIKVNIPRIKSPRPDTALPRHYEDRSGPRNGQRDKEPYSRDSRPQRPRDVASTPADKEDMWSRRLVPPPTEQRKSEVIAPPEPPPTKPSERPVIKLQPRTVPLSEIGKPVAIPSIFGEGKPRDEIIHDKKKETSISDTSPQVVDTKDSKVATESAKQPSQVSDNNESKDVSSAVKSDKYNKDMAIYRPKVSRPNSKETTVEANVEKESDTTKFAFELVTKAEELSIKEVAEDRSEVEKVIPVKTGLIIEEGIKTPTGTVPTNRDSTHSRSGRSRGGRSDDRSGRHDDRGRSSAAVEGRGRSSEFRGDGRGRRDSVGRGDSNRGEGRGRGRVDGRDERGRVAGRHTAPKDQTVKDSAPVSDDSNQNKTTKPDNHISESNYRPTQSSTSGRGRNSDRSNRGPPRSNTSESAPPDERTTAKTKDPKPEVKAEVKPVASQEKKRQNAYDALVYSDEED